MSLLVVERPTHFWPGAPLYGKHRYGVYCKRCKVREVDWYVRGVAPTCRRPSLLGWLVALALALRTTEGTER